MIAGPLQIVNDQSVHQIIGGRPVNAAHLVDAGRIAAAYHIQYGRSHGGLQFAQLTGLLERIVNGLGEELFAAGARLLLLPMGRRRRRNVTAAAAAARRCRHHGDGNAGRPAAVR